MPNLDIRFIPRTRITPQLQGDMDELDHVAFAENGHAEDPEFSSIQWSAPDWMGLGFLEGRLVTQLCLPRRRIKAGTQEVWVAGIGGMATHPEFQHRGLGSALLAAAGRFMREEIGVPFGLLICADETRPFYERSHWQAVADILYYIQDGQRRKLKTCVMILSLTDHPWPAGEIDLCGPPW